MGFNVTALAQKARTQTLIVDSDLDMGQYDVIATDVKGDTAEFSEFVGGVGNFTSITASDTVLIDGNTEIEGDCNVDGSMDILGAVHVEDNVQIDGNLLLEGSLNNVNFGTNGAITTAGKVTASGGFAGNLSGNVSGGTVSGTTGTFSGAVTGANFNGVKIKSTGAYTVTPTNTFIQIPYASWDVGFVSVLPFSNVPYTGSLTVKNTSSGYGYFQYITSADSTVKTVGADAGATATLSFTNVNYLMLANNGNYRVDISNYTLS